jgi:hypothetical protein
MKKLTITIKTENAAFTDDPGWEVGRILHDLSEKYRHGDPIPSTLHDLNGNTVGKVVAS